MKYAFFLLFIAAPVFAHEPTKQPEPTATTEISSPSVDKHSGRTDSSGCHHDRKNGGYHCH